MTDESERKDMLVPGIYPRSLLYFVSGVLERDAKGAAAPGKPLVGLARFFDAPRQGEPRELDVVRRYVMAAVPNVVWSPSQGPEGMHRAPSRTGTSTTTGRSETASCPYSRDDGHDDRRAEEPAHFALVVGINRYPGISDLRMAKTTPRVL